MQGSVRREVEWYRKSFVKCVPTAAVFCFSENMPFKQSDSLREDSELFRQSLEIDFEPFNITLAQKIAHCFLERMFGGRLSCRRKILMKLLLMHLQCSVVH